MIEARHDRVVIRPVKLKGVTDGGIILPDNSKVQNSEGEVVAAGPDSSCKAGQFVVYARYAGQEVEHEGENFVIVPDSQVYAVKPSKTRTA